MTDERLNELLDDARRTWPLPPEPDYQAMWGRIERESFGAKRAETRTPSWRLFSLGIAAALMMGIGLGRCTMKPAATAPTVALQGASTDTAIPASNEYDKAASELLGRTVVLLTSLPSEARTTGSGRPANVATLRLCDSSRLKSSSDTPSIWRMARAISSRTSCRRPSLKFGTHSMRLATDR